MVHKVDPARHGAPDLPAHWQWTKLLAAHAGQVPAPVTSNQNETAALSIRLPSKTSNPTYCMFLTHHTDLKPRGAQGNNLRNSLNLSAELVQNKLRRIWIFSLFSLKTNNISRVFVCLTGNILKHFCSSSVYWCMREKEDPFSYSFHTLIFNVKFPCYKNRIIL